MSRLKPSPATKGVEPWLIIAVFLALLILWSFVVGWAVVLILSVGAV